MDTPYRFASDYRDHPLHYMDPLIDYHETPFGLHGAPYRFQGSPINFSRDVMDAPIDLLKITWIPLYTSLTNYMVRSL